ncbi:MAG: DUF2461 domain-containing protein [Thermoplasmata archaeon]|nr:DUF2461 domain-containing protein [Thermoplasmata archaeon]
MGEIAPFTGFPAQGLQFLRDLEKNNNREWFQAHKQVYLDQVQTPAQSFVVAMGERLKEISPGLRYDTRTNGPGSMGRIYRDTRFSKDKSPYNTHVWFGFWEGPGKKMESPGFGVGFDTEGWGIHGGHHMFSKPMLETFREAVDDDALGPELEQVMKPLQKDGGYEIGEAKYKRVPRGYDPDHPRAHWLRYAGLWAYKNFRESEVLEKPEFVDRVFDVAQELAPLHRWMVKVDQRLRAKY